MRSWSHSTDSGGFSPDPNGKPAGGRKLKMKFPKMWRGKKVPSGATSITIIDGHTSPEEKEPPNVTLTFEENLEGHHLCEAGKLLIQRENDLFLETREEEALHQWEEEVDKLAADRKSLEAAVLQALGKSLCKEEDSIKTLTSAVTAILQEEEQDQLWTQKAQTPPAWRPSSWRKVHNSTLCSIVEERMDNPSTPPAVQVEQSSIQADLYSMGRQLKEDLLYVVEVVKRCYPSKLNICQFYATLYHQTFSARLKKIADFVLDDKDCTFLLRWVNQYYPELLQKPQLTDEIDIQALGKLLPEEVLEPLEEQYLSKQQSELTVCIGQVLQEARKRWNNGQEPEREDGRLVSPVAFDVIQFVNGIVTSTEMVLRDRRKARDLTCELKDLLQGFKSFQDDVMKQNKRNSVSMIKANLGCVDQFRDFLRKKSQLFPEDVQQSCLSVLADMRRSAHMFLLAPVHKILKPHYRKLGTWEWLNKSSFEGLLVAIEEQIEDLQGCSESSHQGLISQFHLEVTTEYVRRLLKGEVKLKGKEQQQMAYTTVVDNTESLHALFIQQESKEVWLKEVLTMIAAVLKLQDLPAIQMEVITLGTSFPDLSVKHVSALLKLKMNLSKADRSAVKAILSDTLKEMDSIHTQPFFSRIPIK
ncbi:tumor necrosis factor alpha-induced protein 2-like [Aulostomus maculatus]